MKPWKRLFLFKAVSLLSVLSFVYYLTGFRPNDSMRISQSTSIVVKDQQLQHQHSVTAHRNQSKPIVDDQKFAKYLMKNDNATRLIPSEINDSPSNINTSANHPHVIVDTEQSTLLNDNTNSKPCPLEPSDLTGPIDVAIEYESLESIAQRFHGRVEPGGYYKPIECTQVNNRVAIVIPYRDKLAHLSIFLKNMHPFLQKQQADYGIFVVEQFGSGLFNRAALLNIGFLEARKLSQWDCFIFHDVDLIPLDNRNLYRCPKQPRHMSVAVDTMQFKLPYSSIFGGVSAMTVDQFQSVNGFSNAFEGWGGEDDDMSNRLKHAGYHISRYPTNIARYKMLYHRKEKANPKRFENLKSGAKKFNSEGLNSIKYEIHALKLEALYTWILAEIKSVPSD